MRTMDTRKIVHEIITDIANGAQINKVLFKAQIIASNIGNENFTNYIRREQQGYTSEYPVADYRHIKTRVEATFAIPFSNMQKVIVPVELVENKQIRDLLNFVDVREPLGQIEQMYNNAENSMISVNVPAFAYSTIESLYENNNARVYIACHKFPKESLLNIVETFKSRLLQLLLDFDKELDWKLDLSTEQNRQTVTTIINNINAIIANTGNGNVDTNNINIDNDKHAFVGKN